MKQFIKLLSLLFLLQISDKTLAEDWKTDLNKYFGINLAGAEFGISADAPHGVDGTNYGYPTEVCLDYFGNKGLKLIRFPFRWERVQHDLNGDLDPYDLNKMKVFVQAAEDRNMPIILDMHNFCRRFMNDGNLLLTGKNDQLTAAHLADVWKKLATEFKDYNNIYGYDIMNEPYAMPATDTWFNIAQTVIDAIRTVDTETPIIISGDAWSSAAYWEYYSDNLKNLVDPSDKLIYQAHTYFDKDSSGNYALSYDDDGANAQTGVNRVRPFVEWLKANKKVGFIGEYGIPDDDVRWLTVLENMLRYLHEQGVTGTYWAAGPRWGNYKLSVHPTNNYMTDRPQMAVLEKFATPSEIAEVHKYEAEDAEFIGGEEEPGTAIENAATSGGKYVQTGRSSLRFNINLEETGKYNVNVYVRGELPNDGGQYREALFYINCTWQIVNDSPALTWSERHAVYFDGTIGEFNKKTIVNGYEFTAGEHYIYLDAEDPGSWDYYNIDYLELERLDEDTTSTIPINPAEKEEFTVKIQNNNILIIASSETNYRASIHDITGRNYYTTQNLSGNTALPTLQQTGIYLISIESKSGKKVFKVIL